MVAAGSFKHTGMHCLGQSDIASTSPNLVMMITMHISSAHNVFFEAISLMKKINTPSFLLSFFLLEVFVFCELEVKKFDLLTCMWDVRLCMFCFGDAGPQDFKWCGGKIGDCVMLTKVKRFVIFNFWEWK